MKKSTKLKLVLLGTAFAVGGAALYFYLDDSAREKLESAINRERAKMLVSSSEKGASLIPVIDRLSDQEVNAFVKLADNASDFTHSAGDALSNLVDKAKEVTDRATSKVTDYFD